MVVLCWCFFSQKLKTKHLAFSEDPRRWPTDLADVGHGPAHHLHLTLEALNTWGEDGEGPKMGLTWYKEHNTYNVTKNQENINQMLQ